MRRDILQKALKIAENSGSEEFLEGIRWALAEVQKQDQDAGIEPKAVDEDEWDPKFLRRVEKILEAYPNGLDRKPWLNGPGIPEICYAPLRPVLGSTSFKPNAAPPKPPVISQEDHSPAPQVNPASVLAALRLEHNNVPKGC